MPTIRGYLEHVDKLSTRVPRIQIRTFLPSGGDIVIRVRATIGAQTLATRGTESIEISSLREGEFVEVSYRQGSAGQLEAEAIYVQQDAS